MRTTTACPRPTLRRPSTRNTASTVLVLGRRWFRAGGLLFCIGGLLLLGCDDSNPASRSDVRIDQDTGSSPSSDTASDSTRATTDSAAATDSAVENATDTEEEQATDTGVASDTSTDNDTGSGPDDVNLAECITPSACDGKRVEITTTAIWSGSDYSADYRCVLALLRTAAAGELAPTTLALSAGAFGDSPTQYNVALGYAQPEAGLQALYFPNGGQSSADPTVRCTLAGTEIYQDCLDNPSLNCIGKDALFPSCAPDVMVCP